MKNKIAFVITTCGGIIAAFGGMGLDTEGHAGFVLALKITFIGLAIAGSGLIMEKLTNKKSVAP